MWAEGEPITLPKDLWEAAAEAQKARVPVDPWLDVLAAVKGTIVNGSERISTRDLFGEEYIHISAGQRQDYHAKRLSKNMKELGWDGSKSLKIDGKAMRGYSRPAERSITDDTLEI